MLLFAPLTAGPRQVPGGGCGFVQIPSGCRGGLMGLSTWRYLGFQGESISTLLAPSSTVLPPAKAPTTFPSFPSPPLQPAGLFGEKTSNLGCCSVWVQAGWCPSPAKPLLGRGTGGGTGAQPCPHAARCPLRPAAVSQILRRAVALPLPPWALPARRVMALCLDSQLQQINPIRSPFTTACASLQDAKTPGSWELRHNEAGMYVCWKKINAYWS